MTRSVQFAALGPTGLPLFGTVDRTAASAPSGTAADVWGEGRVQVAIGAWDLQPNAGLRTAWYRTGEWAETGASALSLTGSSGTNRSTQADAGVRASFGAGRIRPFFEGVYRHELSSRRTTSLNALAGEETGVFAVEGADFAAGSLLGKGGLYWFMSRFALTVVYELKDSSTQHQHSLQLGVGF